MIIKIIPEEHETHIKEVEHHNVKEFLIFGNKRDGDGEPIDFHDWSGQYRYLMGSLYYFQEIMGNEQSAKAAPGTPQPMVPSMGEGIIKQIANDHPDIKIIKTGEVDAEPEDNGEMEVEEVDTEEVPVEDEGVIDFQPGKDK